MEIEIFRAGKRSDANGNVFDIDTKALSQVVASYNPAYHEAPIVIGHPKDNTPAYAWVNSLRLDGDVLKANLSQIDPDFSELVKTGKYKKVSASFYTPDSPANPSQGNWSLRHVGFLGAMPPAVKGLKQPMFGESSRMGIVDFTENESESDDEPTDTETTATDSKQAQTVSATDATTHQSQGEKPMSDTEKQELESLRAQVAKLQAEKADAVYKTRQAENASFAEKLVNDGRLAPIAKDAAIALLDGALSQDLAAADNADFSEDSALLPLVQNFLNACPQVASFGEYAKNGKKDAQGLSHHERACALMHERSITYEEAARLSA